MLKSMTGFGTATVENSDYKVTVELKSVNQRFLELNFHMGRQLAVWEDDMRRAIKAVAARGKMDIYVNFVDKRDSAASIRINEGLVKAYYAALTRVGELTGARAEVTAVELAAIPELLTIDETRDISDMQPVLLQALTEALAGFDAMRCAEGENICADFRARLATLAALRDRAEQVAPSIVEDYRTRLTERLTELLADNIDETRIIQEVAIFADKVNYTEEVVRLGSHFKQFYDIIDNATEPVGRKLDFLIQELNRETNTIGSKANKTEIAQVVVDMKCEIEKLREQVQNIE